MQRIIRQDAELFLQAHADKETQPSLVIFDPPGGLDKETFGGHIQQAAEVCRTGGSLVFIGSHRMSAEFSAKCESNKLNMDRMGDIAVLWSYPIKGKKKRIINPTSRSSVITWYVKKGFRGRTFETIDLPSNVIVAQPVPFEERVNPAQKPVEVFNYIMSVMSDGSGCVLDPYCGSGSSLIAGHMNSRTVYGCDIDAQQVQSAKQRLMLIEDEMQKARPLWWWVARGKYKSIDGGEEDVMG